MEEGMDPGKRDEETRSALRAFLGYAGLAGVYMIALPGAGEGRSPGAAACARCPLSGRAAGMFSGLGGSAPVLAFVALHPPPPADEGPYTPFGGPMGGLLERIVASPGYAEEDVHLCFAMRCIPPEGTGGEELERAIEACRTLLVEDLRALSPRVVIAMGQGVWRALSAGGRAVRPGEPFEAEGLLVMPTLGLEELYAERSLRREAWSHIREAMRMAGQG